MRFCHDFATDSAEHVKIIWPNFLVTMDDPKMLTSHQRKCLQWGKRHPTRPTGAHLKVGVSNVRVKPHWSVNLVMQLPCN